MFGKAMSIPDSALPAWERHATVQAPDELQRIHLVGERRFPAPLRRKLRLAKAIVADFHGWDVANDQEARFDFVHRQSGLPDDIPATLLPMSLWSKGSIHVPKVLVALGLASSNSEARRLIDQGAVRVNGTAVPTYDVGMTSEDLIDSVWQVGKHRMTRVVGFGGEPSSEASD
jgi:tyrosyl-tRNA synthetase